MSFFLKELSIFFTKLIQAPKPAECCGDDLPKGCWSTGEFSWVTPHRSQINQTKLNGQVRDLRGDERGALEIRDQRLTDLDGMDFGDSWAIKTHARNVFNRAYERYIFNRRMDYKDERKILHVEAEVVYNGNLSTRKNLTYESQWFWLKTPKIYTESSDKYSWEYLGTLNAYRKAYSKCYYSSCNHHTPYIFEVLSDIKNFITTDTLPIVGAATLLITIFLTCTPEIVQTAYLNLFTQLPIGKIIIAHLVGDMVLQAHNWYHNKAISFTSIGIWARVLIYLPITTYLSLMLTMDHSVQTINYSKLQHQISYWFNARASFLSYKLSGLFSILMNKSYLLGTCIILYGKASIECFYEWLSSFWS